nr:lysozyme inhibitor LprI family protein [Rhodoferax sp.]
MNKYATSFRAWALLIALGAVHGSWAQEPLDLTALAAGEVALNDAYRSLRGRASGREEQNMVEAQRSWLRSRNSECGLTPQETANKEWPLNLSNDKANCVLRTSRERTLALTHRESVAKGAIEGFADSSQLSSITEFTLPVGHSKGKWYAEVSILRGIVVGADKVGFQVGVDNVNAFYAIGLKPIAGPADEKTEVVGIAMDLDANQLRWRGSVVPSAAESSAALAVNEKPFSIKVKANDSLAQWLSRGHVSINYGQAPFRYTPPAGYVPWFNSPGGRDDLSRGLIPAYERPNGKDVDQTARAFWQWLLDRESVNNPVRDRDGSLCHLHQKGAQWFLASAAAVDGIERACTVPYGVNIVVPVMASMFTAETPEGCKVTSELAKLSPYPIHDSFLEIDGMRFDRLQDYSASSSTCAPLDIAGRQLAKHANWLGMWVTLRPLSRGQHTIAFGARIKAMHQDRRVTYKITVR